MVSSISKDSQLWIDLPWKKFQKHLLGLQSRVYKATQLRDYRKVIKLQRLILRSNSSKFLAIKEIELGERVSLLESKEHLYLDSKNRFQICTLLNEQLYNRDLSSINCIQIEQEWDKLGGFKMRLLLNRAWQEVSLRCLYPVDKALNYSKTYNLCLETSPHEIQKILFLNLNSKSHGYDKRVMKLNVTKSFYNLNYKLFIRYIIAPIFIKRKIFEYLLTQLNVEFSKKMTVGNDSVIRFFTNIVLNGVERIHRGIRYNNDIMFFLCPKEDETEILNKTSQFLNERGLVIDQRDVKIYSMTTGFDFLGWHFLSQEKKKFRNSPSAKSVYSLKRKIKNLMKLTSISIVDKVSKLIPIIRKWKNYNKFCNNKKSKLSLWKMGLALQRKFDSKKENFTSSKMLLKFAFLRVPS